MKKFLRPELKKYDAPKTWRGMYDLYKGNKIDELQIAHSITFVKERWDCSDFRMVPLIRTMYQLKDKISEDAKQMITDAILQFKYWYDEPGSDDLCFTTENHQILFHSSEYLAGQMFKDEIFRNSGMTGLEHQKKARHMILMWLEDRFTYGMSEWLSPVYYEEDIPPLCNLIDFAEDPEIVEKAKMVLDILLLDIAMHNFKGAFTTTSGRCYQNQKMHPSKTDTAELIDYIWDYGHFKNKNYTRLSTMFYMMENYQVPSVIKAIGNDKNSVEIKTAKGLNVNELKDKIISKRDPHDAGRFLWGMHTFVNPEVFNLSMKLLYKYDMWDNFFIKDLAPFNNWFFRNLNLYGILSKIVNPVQNGMALQRANTYTYKTPHYMISTVQNYHPGTYGEQQHTWSATLNYQTTVFTTSPSSDENNKGYWMGNARHPHSVGHRNINMTIYQLPKKPSLMEKKIYDFTHLYFPVDNFDQIKIEDNMIFGLIDDSFIAVIGKNKLELQDNNYEFIQQGKETYWITELGTREEFSTLDMFIEYIKGKDISYHNHTLNYGNYELTYKGDFKVNEKVINTEYKTFGTPYITAERESKVLKVVFDNKQLILDFKNCVRTVIE